MAVRKVQAAKLSLVSGNVSLADVDRIAKTLSQAERETQLILKQIKVYTNKAVRRLTGVPGNPRRRVAKAPPAEPKGFQKGEQVTYIGGGLSRNLKAGDRCTVKWTDGKYVTVMRNSDKFYTDLAVNRITAVPATGQVARRKVS